MEQEGFELKKGGKIRRLEILGATTKMGDSLN